MNPTTNLDLVNFNIPSFPLILFRADISLKAKALFTIILYWRNNFLDPKIGKEELLLDISKEKIDAIRSGIKELQNAGLLQKKIQRNQDGRRYIIGSSWELMIEWPSDWFKEVE